MKHLSSFGKKKLLRRRAGAARIVRATVAALLFFAVFLAFPGILGALADPLPEEETAVSPTPGESEAPSPAPDDAAEPPAPTPEETAETPSPTPGAEETNASASTGEETPSPTPDSGETPSPTPDDALPDEETADGDADAAVAVSTTAIFYVSVNNHWEKVTSFPVDQSLSLWGGNARFYLTLDQLAAVYAPYGFKAAAYDATTVLFPHTDSADASGSIWADAGAKHTKIDGADNVVIPLGWATAGHYENYVYYTPNNLSGRDGYFTSKQSRSDAAVYNSFYRVRALLADETEVFSRLILTGQSLAVTLPVPESGASWAAVDPSTGETLELPLTKTTDETGAECYKCVLDAVTRPILFRAYDRADTSVSVIYHASLDSNSLLPDISNECKVSQLSIVTDGTVRGQKTEIVTLAANESHTLLRPDNTEASVYLTARSNNRHFYYSFRGWALTAADGSRITLSPGETLSADRLQNLAVNGTVRLTALWSPHAKDDGTKIIASANFFISLDCEYSDKINTTPDVNSFTGSLFFAHVDGAENLAPVTSRELITPPQDAENAYETDAALRSTQSSPVSQGFSFREFPSDEYIFERLRASGKTISVNGQPIESKYLNASHFAIRWYCMKYDRGDGFHVDGILVAKSGRLVVTKTFIGDPAAIESIKSGDFAVTLTKTASAEKDDDASPDYRLVLTPKDETTGGVGYSSYDAETDTYTWVLSIPQGTAYTVQETGYMPADNGWQVFHRWMIRNHPSAGVPSGWSDYNALYGISVTAASYSNDTPDPAVQTVALQNIYVHTGRVTVFKSDYCTKSGIGGVEFTLTDDAAGTPLALCRKPGTHIYAIAGSGVDAEFSETVADGRIVTDANGYFALQLPGGREYHLKETVPTGYYGPDRVTIEMSDGGALLSASAAESGWVSFRADDGFVEITNRSRLLTNVTVTVNWGKTPESDRAEVSASLFRNGIDLSADNAKYEQVLSAENGWSYTWTNLPLYADGSAAVYTVREERIGPAAYDPSLKPSGYERYSIVYDDALYREGTSGEYDRKDATWLDDTGTRHYADHMLLNVRNSVFGSEFSFTKCSDRGDALPGATFTLYSDPACTQAIQSAVSDENGLVSFDYRSNGVYYLRENAAPAGYGVDTTYYRVIVENGAAVLRSPGSGAELTELVNQTSVVLRLKKVNALGEGLSGAVFVLSDGDTARSIPMTGDTLDVRISVSGAYTLRETTAPAGYEIRADSFSFTTGSGALAPDLEDAGDGWILSEEDGVYVLTVTDSALYALPTTGGRAAALPLLGTALLCVSAAALLPRRRKPERKSQTH